MFIDFSYWYTGGTHMLQSMIERIAVYFVATATCRWCSKRFRIVFMKLVSTVWHGGYMSTFLVSIHEQSVMVHICPVERSICTPSYLPSSAL